MGRSSPAPALAEPGGSPVRWSSPPVLWAMFGAACVLIQVSVLTVWATDDPHGDFGGNLRGLTYDGDLSAVLKATTQLLQIGIPLLWLGLVAVCWRLSRAAGAVTPTTAMLAGYSLTFWTEPYSGTFEHAVGDNLHSVNVATWGSYLPGWQGPTPQAISVLIVLGYPLIAGWLMISLGVLRVLRARRPAWSRARVAIVAAALMFVVDIVLEHVYMRMGGYAYPRALPYLTLFEGDWYQLPLSSPGAILACCVLPFLLPTIYTRPGREVWFLEGSRSIPQPAVRNGIRLLAGVGYANACIFAFQVAMLLCSLISHPIDLPAWIDLPAEPPT